MVGQTEGEGVTSREVGDGYQLEFEGEVGEGEGLNGDGWRC